MVASIIMYSLSWSLANSLKIRLENPALRPPAKALVDDLPIAETLWKIPPRDAGPISIQNRFDEQSVIGRRAAHVAFAAGKKILDPIPLIVAQCITSHRSAP